jgi:hypothetical protein
MAAIVIFYPGVVTSFIPKHQTEDPSKVEIRLEAPDAGGSEGEPGQGGDEESRDENSAADLQRQLGGK